MRLLVRAVWLSRLTDEATHTETTRTAHSLYVALLRLSAHAIINNCALTLTSGRDEFIANKCIASPWPFTSDPWRSIKTIHHELSGVKGEGGIIAQQEMAKK